MLEQRLAHHVQPRRHLPAMHTKGKAMNQRTKIELRRIVEMLEAIGNELDDAARQDPDVAFEMTEVRVSAARLKRLADKPQTKKAQ